MMRLSILISILFFISAQETTGQGIRTSVFIDCQIRCNMSYVKEQITFINYMQNRQEADIYVLATWQNTGAGGQEIQLAFVGNHKFDGMRDTIKYMVDPNATESIERDQFVKHVKRGLLKYIVQTDIIEHIAYAVDSPTSEITEVDENDPWNYWVFNLGGNGWSEGEESYQNMNVSGRISATRITDKHKFEFSSFYNYRENTFTLTDGEEFTSIFKSYNLYLEYVKSLNQHWSLGGISRAGSSTFGNTDVQTTIKAAIEYNIFPYSDAQTRRFSFLYAIGPEFYDYSQITIYDKEKEWVARQSLNIEYEQTQKWGDISITLGVEQYFHSLRLYNAYLNPQIEWQIFTGLTLNLGGYFSFVNDRINIAKSDISDEDILLQIKQIDTDFSYFSHFGINYRFGSKFNNFVNPRF